jgi:hypothetical protein
VWLAAKGDFLKEVGQNGTSTSSSHIILGFRHTELTESELWDIIKPPMKKFGNKCFCCMVRY